MLIILLLLIHTSILPSIQICQRDPSTQFLENIKKCYTIPNVNCASCALTNAGVASEKFILQLAKDRFYYAKTSIFTQYTVLTGYTVDPTLTKNEEELLAKYVNDFLKNYNIKKSAHLFHQTRDVTDDSSSSKEDDDHSREQTPEYHSDDESCSQNTSLCNPCINEEIHEQKITWLQAKKYKRD